MPPRESGPGMPDVFLSYSREDQPTARRYAEALQREGLDVWWDQALSVGEAFDQVTEKALEDARTVVVLWSKHSVDSRWVRAEATQAQASNRLAPVMIESCKRPIMFELTQTADLADWNGDTNDARWRAFVGGLRKFIDRGGATSATSAERPTGAPPRPAAPAARRTGRKRLVWVVAAIAALAFGTGLIWYLHGRQVATPAGGQQASIAVLPFDDMSPGKDQAYFADGVAEEILNQLARIESRQLRVIARNSSFMFRGGADLKEVGARLGVEHVLEGSVRKSGEQLRITAQLINTKTDAHLWSKTYDRSLAGVFEVQEEIARSVAEALQISLGVGIGRQPGMTRDVQAYDLYLQANALWNLFTPETRRRSLDLLEQAVRRDPSFAQAWGSLTATYSSMPQFLGADSTDGERQDWLRKAGDASAEFERLMKDTPDLFFATADRAVGAGDWSAAARNYRAAFEALQKQFGVRMPEFLNGTPSFLLLVGRSREALPLLKQGKASDPLNAGAAWVLARGYANTGDVAAALAELERGDQLGGNMQILVRALGVTTALSTGERALIARWLAGSVAVSPSPEARAFGESIQRRLDDPRAALEWLRSQRDDPSSSSITLGVIAVYLAGLGDAQGALDILRSRRIGGAGALGTTELWNPVFRDMRKLPDFKALMRDWGLLDYWKEYGWGDHCKPTTAEDFECQ